jgi:hypothetical protein
MQVGILEVLAAFNSVPSEVLFGVFEAQGNAARPRLVYCGDTQAGTRLASGLIRDVGFAPVDVGPLRIGRYIESFALLVGQLAYGTGTGVPVRAVGQIRPTHNGSCAAAISPGNAPSAVERGFSNGHQAKRLTALR